MTFDLSWALMRLRPRRKLGWPFFWSGGPPGKGRQQAASVVVLPSWCSISWRVASLTVSRARRSLPASMKHPLSLPKGPWSRHRKRLAWSPLVGRGH